MAIAQREHYQLASELPAPTDTKLVAAALMHDRDACEQIWMKYSPLVNRLIKRFFGPGPDHQDLCQEVFLRVFRRLRELRDPAALRGFVISVCLGVARNAVRRARFRSIVGLEPDEQLHAVPAPTGSDEAREATWRLYHLLDQLGAEDRSLFVSRYVERMDLAEVANAHDMSLGTTRRRVARMTRRVSTRMQGDPILASYACGLARAK